MEIINFFVIIIYSYGFGCFCSAYYLIKSSNKKDIRILNTGTVGATNAGRILGKKGFVLTFIGDFLKTFIALSFTIYFFKLNKNFSILFLISSIAIMLGHIFPIQLKFKGGKGLVVFIAIIFVINFLVLFISLSILFLLKLMNCNKKFSIAISVLATIPISLILINYYPLLLDKITIFVIFITIIFLIISHSKKMHANI